MNLATLRNGAIVVFAVCLAGTGFAQTKTITNADLEKFRLKRLAAEKELRENYEKLGFPSPEELERQNEQSARDLSERSDRYRRLNLERERIARESRDSETVYYPAQNGGWYYTSGYAPAYRYNYGYGYRRYPRRFKYKKRYWRQKPGYISNPIIRWNWLRQSESMRRTYRGTFRRGRIRR